MNLTRTLAAPLRQRNFSLGVINGVIFTVVDALLDPNLVLVTFASFLTGSHLILGLVAPLNQAGWYLPQLWVSGWLQSKPTSLSVYRLMAVIRVACFAMLVPAVLFVRSADWKLFLFLLLLAANQLAAGLSGLSFMDVVAKVVPAGQRGLFFAWRLTLGGCLGIGAGLWLRGLLDSATPATFSNNFALIFGAAGLLSAAGMAAFSRVNEPPNETIAPRAAVGMQLRRAREVIRGDANYRRLLGLRLALIAASIGTPFFAVYARQQFSVPPATVGLFLSANIAASLVAYMIWGQVSARAGNRAVLQWSGVLGMVVLAVVLLTPLLHAWWSGQTLFTLVFVLVGIRDAGINVSIGPLLLDLAPPALRPLYVGFTNTLVGTAVLLTGASGLLVDLAGFPVLFAVAFGSYAVATWHIWQFREQPVPAVSVSRACR